MNKISSQIINTINDIIIQLKKNSILNLLLIILLIMFIKILILIINTDVNIIKKCKLIMPCCNKPFSCRLCHDEEMYDNNSDYSS